MKYYDKVIADAFEKSKSTETSKCNGHTSSEINMSSICTKLIQETGRFCEQYADDLLIDIARVKTICKNMDSIEHEAHAYVAFGIRRDGVDSNSYIAIRFREGGTYRSHSIINDYYRRVYCVKISRIENSFGSMETVLELKNIQNELTYNSDYDACLEDEAWSW
jgi:hypothetical protein